MVKARARPDIRWVYVEKFQRLDKMWVAFVICVRQIFMFVHQTELSRYAVEIRFRVEKMRRSRKSEERWKREKTISLLKKKEMTREIWQMLGLKYLRTCRLKICKMRRKFFGEKSEETMIGIQQIYLVARYRNCGYTY